LNNDSRVWKSLWFWDLLSLNILRGNDWRCRRCCDRLGKVEVHFWEIVWL